MNNCINNILKIREEIKNLNNKICILKKEKDDIDLKINTFDSINTINEEIKSLKNILKAQNSLIFPFLLCLAGGGSAMFYLFALNPFVTNILLARFLLGILSSLMICFSIEGLLKTFKSIKKYKLKIKNKGAELDSVFNEVNSYGITKEELINNSYILESQIFNMQKTIDYNNIKINELKQDIINHYVKNNVNIKTLKEAVKVKKLSK